MECYGRCMLGFNNGIERLAHTINTFTQIHNVIVQLLLMCVFLVRINPISTPASHFSLSLFPF